MKGIVVTTDNIMTVQEFSVPLYKTVGAAVGGYIKRVKPRGLPEPFCMIVNEEGLLLELEENTLGSVLYGTPTHGQPIVGNIVLMKDGYRNGEPDIVGLEEKEIEMLGAAFKPYVLKFERSNSND